MRTLALSLRKRVHCLLTESDATTATEYSVMLALIVVVALTAIGALGTGLKNNVAWTVTDALNG